MASGPAELRNGPGALATASAPFLPSPNLGSGVLEDQLVHRHQLLHVLAASSEANAMLQGPKGAKDSHKRAHIGE